MRWLESGAFFCMSERTLPIASKEQLESKEAFGLDVDLDDGMLLGGVRHGLLAIAVIQERRHHRPASVSAEVVWEVWAHGQSHVTTRVQACNQGWDGISHQKFQVHNISRRGHPEDDIPGKTPDREGSHVHQ
jgi:hypothetical protein